MSAPGSVGAKKRPQTGYDPQDVDRPFIRPYRSRLRKLLGEEIPKSALGVFFERLALLLAPGMLIPEALRGAGNSSDSELCEMAAAAERPVSAGVPLYRALAPWRKRLPEIVLPVLEVGEVSGTLQSAAQRLADCFLRSDAVEKRFRYQVFDWKLIILLVALQSIALDVSSPPLLRVLRFFQVLAQTALLLLIGRFVLRALFRWPPARLAVDTIKLAVPHMGQVTRNLSAARWARSFATMWHAGVPVSQALEVSSRSTLNAVYERAIQCAAERTRRGMSIAESLADTQMLPGHLLDILRTGETSGSPGRLLDQMVIAMEDEALTMATQEFATIITLGKVVICIAAVGAAMRL